MRNGRAWATGAVVGVLVLLGLPASGATSADADADVAVTGVLVVAADGAGRDRAFALALDDGSLVPVTGDLDERWANARVSARVRVPTGTGLRTATRPLGVSDVRLVGPRPRRRPPRTRPTRCTSPARPTWVATP